MTEWADAGNSRQTNRTARQPQPHRTIDRVTQILEEVVYRPGMTFGELVRALGAAKSSVHGFIQGLLANGWLYESQGHYYLGPAVYGLTLASGQIRAGLVTQADLEALHQDTQLTVFLGVQAGDHVIYIAERRSETGSDFSNRANIRRDMLATATGKVLLASKSPAEVESYLRRYSGDDAALVDAFLAEYDQIRATGIARNLRLGGRRCAIATTVHDQEGKTIAAITLVGDTTDVEPRARKLSRLLLKRADSWSQRTMLPREPI